LRLTGCPQCHHDQCDRRHDQAGDQVLLPSCPDLLKDAFFGQADQGDQWKS
jgi:hypothetical protein